MTTDPPMVDYVASCEICGQPATWRSVPHGQDVEHTARVIHCATCRFAFVEPWKAQPREKPQSVIGWLAERIAG